KPHSRRNALIRLDGKQSPNHRRRRWASFGQRANRSARVSERLYVATCPRGRGPSATAAERGASDSAVLLRRNAGLSLATLPRPMPALLAVALLLAIPACGGEGDSLASAPSEQPARNAATGHPMLPPTPGSGQPPTIDASVPTDAAPPPPDAPP